MSSGGFLGDEGFLRRTLRGARLIEFGGLTVMLALALAVYLVKARAGRETSDITQVESQIADAQKRVHLLQAESAHLEQPQRLQRLAEAAGLAPTTGSQETTLERLPDVAREAELAGASKAKPKPAPVPAGPAASAAPAGQTGAPQ